MKINLKKDSVTPAEILFFLSEREYSLVSPISIDFSIYLARKILINALFISYCLRS
jgi:hypothetical protein